MDAIAQVIILLFASSQCVVMSENVQWAFNTYMDEEYTLFCNVSQQLLANVDQIRWQIPSGKNLADTEKTDKHEVQTYDSVPGMALRILKVSEGDLGVYVCSLYDGATEKGKVVRTLNLAGPMYRSLNDKYRPHFIVAIISTAVFLVPMLAICIVYRFRYRSPYEDKIDDGKINYGMREDYTVDESMATKNIKKAANDNQSTQL